MINEHMKAWGREITDEEYEIAVGLKPAKEQGNEKRSDAQEMVQKNKS